MQIEPKIRGFLCTTAHPKGCQQHIAEQVKQVKSSPHLSLASEAPENVLIIGGSAGYGLASRIVCGAGYGATTLSISLEKPPKENKTASAGWYNNHYFQEWSESTDLPSYSIFGDAFSAEVKQQALELIREKMGSIDLVVYSLAAPRRTKVDPNQESVSYQSVIKPVGRELDGYTVDTASSQLKAFHLEPASPQEISDTVAVMGGEDWFDWMKFLSDAKVLSSRARTVAFSYLGGELTKSVYGQGTLGAAKEDLEQYCQRINQQILPKQGPPRANVAVLKAIVTQSSAAIPSLPLYISMLYRVMKDQGSHETCIDQIIRLFETGLYPASDQACQRDKPFRFRLDDLELTSEVQDEVRRLWEQVTDETLSTLGDVEGYRSDFLKLFGFDWPGVNYEQAVSAIPEQS